MVLGVVAWVWRRYRPTQTWVVIALGLTVGGAVGNLIDRVSTGTVTDFIDFRVFPVFNVADSSIVIGVGDPDRVAALRPGVARAAGAQGTPGTGDAGPAEPGSPGPPGERSRVMSEAEVREHVVDARTRPGPGWTA